MWRRAGSSLQPGRSRIPTPEPSTSANAGEGLFTSMNCDGCHGGGAYGWAGPSLVDGRWRYGGADEEMFTSIFYGRPKGMPAYGGVLGSDGVWMIVAYLKSQAVPGVVPTASWLAGGSATATPAVRQRGAAAPAAPCGSGRAGRRPWRRIRCRQSTVALGVTRSTARLSARPSRRSPPSTGARMSRRPCSEKVKNGGSGVWGQIPMPANAQVPEQDLQAMVRWILALN